MRKKILFLTLALAMTGAAAGLFSSSAAAATSNCQKVCCPSGGCYICCGLPCDCAM